MTVYLLRNGVLVDKRRVQIAEEIARRGRDLRDDMQPARPYVSRFEAYESPIDGKTVSSDRQRELDLYKSNSYDERDVGPNHSIAKAKAERKAENAVRAGPQPNFWR